MRPISVKARNNFQSFHNGSVMKLKSLHLNKKVTQNTRVFFTIFWPNDFSHFLTLVKSKVSGTYTLLTLGKAMYSFTWENKNVSLILEVLS